MNTTPIIRMPEQNNGVMLRGHPMAFLVTGGATRHTSMFDWTIPAGFATGLHVHRVQEETFYVLDGECEWHVGNETVRALVGTFLFIPPGVPHNITNVSERPARVLMTVSPPGHEHYFEELAQLAASGVPDPKALAALRDRYDTDQLSTLTTRA
jgi:quercetin dioxygenase-like cupin family protein